MAIHQLLQIGSIPSRRVAAESQICASMVGRTNGCRGSLGVTNSRPETGTNSWKRTRRLSSRSSLFVISGWQRCLDDKALGSTGDIVVPSRWVNCAQQRSMSSELICPPLGWKVLTSGSPYFHIICDCLWGAFFWYPRNVIVFKEILQASCLIPESSDLRNGPLKRHIITGGQCRDHFPRFGSLRHQVWDWWGEWLSYTP